VSAPDPVFADVRAASRNAFLTTQQQAAKAFADGVQATFTGERSANHG
jgi:hypothetical protein